MAEYCFFDKVISDGVGRIHFVRLEDGYLMDCGTGLDAEKRARTVAGKLNKAEE